MFFRKENIKEKEILQDEVKQNTMQMSVNINTMQKESEGIPKELIEQLEYEKKQVQDLQNKLKATEEAEAKAAEERKAAEADAAKKAEEADAAKKAEIDKEAEATNTTTDNVEWVEDDDGNFVKKGK